MASFTLDDIRAAAEKKYGDLTIPLPEGDAVLVNVLRLSKDKRKALKEVQTKAEADAEDPETDSDEGDVLRESVRIVTQTKEQADRLLAEVGDDLTMLAVIFEQYTGDTEMGEASASQN